MGVSPRYVRHISASLPYRSPIKKSPGQNLSPFIHKIQNFFDHRMVSAALLHVFFIRYKTTSLYFPMKTNSEGLYVYMGPDSCKNII